MRLETKVTGEVTPALGVRTLTLAEIPETWLEANTDTDSATEGKMIGMHVEHTQTLTTRNVVALPGRAVENPWTEFQAPTTE